uniref:Uncharacterized protein n=1 Tax=Brassica oleracea TaxID=3712 RepID=A0A3P6AFS4_BRAOL|nr:unnamed protein product [Brassica oleracea]
MHWVEEIPESIGASLQCCHCSNACCQRHSSRGVQKVYTGDSHSLWTVYNQSPQVRFYNS